MEGNSNNQHPRGTGRGRDGGGGRRGGRGWVGQAQSGGQQSVDRAGGSYRPPQQQTGSGQGAGPPRVESIGVHGSGGSGGGRGGGGGGVWSGRSGLHTQAPLPQQQTGVGQGVDPSRVESIGVHGSGGYGGGSGGGGGGVWSGRPGLHTRAPRSQPQQQTGVGQGLDPKRGESSEVRGRGGYGGSSGGGVWSGRSGLHTQPSPQSQALPGVPL